MFGFLSDMPGKRDVFSKKYIGKDYVARGTDLLLDKEIAWKQIARRARRSIVAARDIPGLVIRRVDGTKEDVDLFRTVWYDPNDADLGNGGFSKNQHVYFAYINEIFVAGIIVTEINKHLFLQFNGASEEAKRMQIPSLMIWHMVEEFTNSSFKFLDIGCSFRKTLQEFFKNWTSFEYPIIYHPPDLVPQIDVTPFGSESFGVAPNDSVDVDAVLTERFHGKPFTYFPRGKHAIYSILKHLCLTQDDEIYVTTTTGSPYLSVGVSTTIEEVCQWSRSLKQNTKAIFLIHEWGIVHPRAKELRELATSRNIPLIEDCAYAWQSGSAGSYGDYVVYSFPKFFPIQYGGLLVGIHFSDQEIWDRFQCLDVQKREQIRSALSSYMMSIDSICEKRRNNYMFLKELCENEDFEPFFSLKSDEVPAVFMLKVENEEKMKEIVARVSSFGIECGAYYHNNAVFLPIHQNLSKKHIEYIFGAARSRYRIDNGIYPPSYFESIWQSKINRNDTAEDGWIKH